MSCVKTEFIEIGNVDVFLESVTITSACNKVMRKRFLKPITIGLIPSGGYRVYREQTDSCTIMHTRNGHDYRPADFPASVWTLSALKRKLSTSSLVAYFTVIRV